MNYWHRLTGQTPSVWKIFSAQGETLIKSGREYRWKEHDSLTVRETSGFATARARAAIPLILSWVDSKSFPEAVQILTGESGGTGRKPPTAPPTAFHLPNNQTADRAILISLRKPRSQQNWLRPFFFRGYLRGRKAALMLSLSERPKQHTEIRPCARNGGPIQTGYCRV